MSDKQNHQLRFTKQRRVILELLGKVSSHPTADEVYQMVRKRLPRVSLATVYRNLEVLSGRGMIKKLKLASTQMRYDGNTSLHYHVRCLRCEAVKDVSIKPITSIEKKVQEISDYSIIGHRLEFVGFCKDCEKVKS